MGRVSSKTIAKNLILSISAQLISIITSFILGFIVPKFIVELQYSYWQTYVLYVSYVGVLHFGLLDGLVLRYSQYDYDELDKRKIRTQFQLLLLFSSILTIGSCLISSFILKGVTLWVVVLVSIGIITKNIFTYTSYIFQITNRISKYAIIVILQRAVYALIIAILLILKIQDFFWYCIADLVGDVVGIFIGAIFNKGLYFGKPERFKEALKEVGCNVSAGIMLMIANFSSSFLVGGAKMAVQWRWDELIFGKVSFSFSVTNLFLTFVTAISVVLFPSMKRMKEEELPALYKKLRNVVSPLLFVILLAYFPICRILELWLPAYSESLVYLGILLPIIIFSSKVSLLTNNYLKAYRKEKLMLIINLTCVALGFGMAILSAYVLNNLDILLYSVVLIIMLRSIVSEIVVMKIIGQKGWFDFIAELLMTVVFIVVVRYTNLWLGCLIYFAALVVYFLLYIKNILAFARTIKAKISDRKKKKSAESTEIEQEENK